MYLDVKTVLIQIYQLLCVLLKLQYLKKTQSKTVLTKTHFTHDCKIVFRLFQYLTLVQK